MKYSGIVAKPWFCLFESFSYMSFKGWRWNISLLKYFSVENIQRIEHLLETWKFSCTSHNLVLKPRTLSSSLLRAIITCDNHMQSHAVFHSIFIVHFCLNFQLICPFLPFLSFNYPFFDLLLKYCIYVLTLQNMSWNPENGKKWMKIFI